MKKGPPTRFVGDGDPEVIPGKQVWIDSDGKVWHDLHFVHSGMFGRGVEKEWREWRAYFLTYMERMSVSAERYFLRALASAQGNKFLDASRV